MAIGKKINQGLAKLKPLDRAARALERVLPQEDPAKVMNEMERGGNMLTYRARQADAAMNFLPDPIKQQLPLEMRGGPASNVWNAAVRAANWMNARNPAKQETPRQRAERLYGEGIEARIRRQNVPQSRRKP